ncbi:hypothetical protein KCU93_g5947, partial [Aureobasidium melanogenum]
MSSTSDEANIPGLHAQILENMRIIDPRTGDAAITTGYGQGLWSAMIWNSEGKVAYCAAGFPSAVDALRILLQYTSSTICDICQQGDT